MCRQLTWHLTEAEIAAAISSYSMVATAVLKDRTCLERRTWQPAWAAFCTQTYRRYRVCTEVAVRHMVNSGQYYLGSSWAHDYNGIDGQAFDAYAPDVKCACIYSDGCRIRIHIVAEF